MEVIKNQQLKINKLNKELLYMEAYSRRENLTITGIPESREDTGVEDTAKVLVDFMANELNVSNAADIDFQRVHRLGKPKDKGPRAIIARFLKYPDKERTLSLGKHLRDKDIHMFSDYPEEIQRSRKRQLKKLKDAKQAGKRRILFSSRKPIAPLKMKSFGIRSGKAKCYFHTAHTIARAPWLWYKIYAPNKIHE
ncbi:unnamed protein product [Pocillopora meandrina]|uniref:Uncharacterized protein n=1 Tax=Pocillopora meandrina TaxID=46732 RepID=A0AAU9W5V3_9CNID|nr:unnamed protein product [Pocillopora meandrina]